MIKELWTSVFTSAPLWARQIGFVNASVALEERAKRCRKAWQAHIEACHEVIKSNWPQEAKKVLIVGSGPMIEIPTNWILNHTSAQLVLLDAVHPRQVRKWLALLPSDHSSRIELVEVDVAGAADLLKKRDWSRFEALEFAPPEMKGRFDFVISANILSQLALDPYSYYWGDKRRSLSRGLKALLNKIKSHESSLEGDSQFFVRLAKKMGDDHISWLKKLSDRVLIYSDIERVYFNQKNEPYEVAPSAYVLKAGELKKEWEWMISPIGESSRQYGFYMKVQARML